MNVLAEIKGPLEAVIKQGKHLAIFPYGEMGLQVETILEKMYGVQPAYIFDNHLCQYQERIRPLKDLADLETSDLQIILASFNGVIYQELKRALTAYVDASQLVEFSRMQRITTKCGKHSYGPLCHHWLVDEVGAFCSFAYGSDVLENHATKYISTSPFIYYDQANNPLHTSYDSNQGCPWYVAGIKPQGYVDKLQKISIGNDVWLGHNVLITNSASIGNGVIAAAGSVITKDVPDYAVVAGAPARVIRYRYSPEQIAALNRIAWWRWSDDKIRTHYNDFFLPIEQFIAKHDVKEADK